MIQFNEEAERELDLAAGNILEAEQTGHPWPGYAALADATRAAVRREGGDAEMQRSFAWVYVRELFMRVEQGRPAHESTTIH